jgi:hypothetical protein
MFHIYIIAIFWQKQIAGNNSKQKLINYIFIIYDDGVYDVISDNALLDQIYRDDENNSFLIVIDMIASPPQNLSFIPQFIS